MLRGSGFVWYYGCLVFCEEYMFCSSFCLVFCIALCISEFHRHWLLRSSASSSTSTGRRRKIVLVASFFYLATTTCSSAFPPIVFTFFFVLTKHLHRHRGKGSRDKVPRSTLLSSCCLNFGSIVSVIIVLLGCSQL